jgi:NitT/TauT family transport system substrate-binding protein
MKRRFYGTFGAGIFAALALSAAGLAVSCSKKQAAAQKLEPFTIITRTNSIESPLAVIARDKGYFQEEGLDPVFITLATGGIETLSIGKADIFLFELIPSLSYAAQGADVKIVGGTASGGNFVVTKPENAERFARLEDWRGAKLGTIRLSTSEMVSRYVLGPLGIDLGADITFTEINDYPNIIEAVRKGQIDIGFVSGSYRQAALDLGLKILFPMTHMYPNYVCCRETAYGKSLREKRELFVKFHQAQIRAYRDFHENREEAIAILMRESSQDRSYVENVIFNLELNGNRVYNPDPDLKRVTAVYETLHNVGYIEKNGIEAADIVDHTVYRDALANIVSRYPDVSLYKDLERGYRANNIDI